MGDAHVPVLVAEVLEHLAPRPGEVVVDCTFGQGGHSRAILPYLQPGGRLIGLDRDPEMIARARPAFAQEPVTLVAADFRDLETILDKLALPAVDGVVFDLGLSSVHLADPERGFSFQRDGPLDMRFDRREPTTAADLIQTLPESELARLFREYGEERWAHRYARAIVRARQAKPIQHTTQLAAVIAAASPHPVKRLRIHPATRVFQALRIAVNRELAGLDDAITAGCRHLCPGGRLVVLAYHSLEDRTVKRTLRALAGCRCPPSLPTCQCGGPLVRLLTRKVVRPSAAEVQRNPRARSARLRAAQQL